MGLTGVGSARQEVVVSATDGLHARPAALFVQAVTRRRAGVSIAKAGGTAVDARSILGVLSLDLRQGDLAVLTAEGEGAEETVAILAALLTAPTGAGLSS